MVPTGAVPADLLGIIWSATAEVRRSVVRSFDARHREDLEHEALVACIQLLRQWRRERRFLPYLETTLKRLLRRHVGADVLFRDEDAGARMLDDVAFAETGKAERESTHRQSDVSALLDCLSGEELIVFLTRSGLTNDRPMSLNIVADRVGMGRETVRKRMLQACRKLEVAAGHPVGCNCVRDQFHPIVRTAHGRRPRGSSRST